MVIAKKYKIAVIGNYLPRRCGIATFTTDLCDSLVNEMKSEDKVGAIAMDDKPQGYDYPDRVKFQVRANVHSDYVWAADFINANQFEIAVIQHEYGIYGGSNGSHVLQMVKALRMPVVVTLHTVLKKPTPEQKSIIKELARYCERLIIMSHKAEKLLNEVYQIPIEKVSFIPHGIPDVSFVEDPTRNHGRLFQDMLGVKNKKIILTFGLLSPNKGIENMIDAMPDIIKQHPDSVYVVIGETHPHVKEATGDSYRLKLLQKVSRLGLNENIYFYNHFVDLDTLVQYLQASTVYVTPYLHKEQITSGTLAYAMGLGAAVVSTPYWYAEELLAENRGVLVDFKNPKEMAEAINHLLDNEQERQFMRFRGYQFCRSMIWGEVARSYIKLTGEVLKKRSAENEIKAEEIDIQKKMLTELPEINLQHFKVLTDDTGMLQHAKFTIPNYFHGYCVDDNARALIVACKYHSQRKDKTVIPYIKKYLGFLFYAFNSENGRFRNFMSYDRRWLELVGSEDSHARALWGLGEAVKYAPIDSIRNMAMRMFVDGLPAVEHFISPRAAAFSIIGLHSYLQIYGGDAFARKMRTILSERLFETFKHRSCEDWPWCEDKVTYANAKLPHALILAGQWIPNPEMHQQGLDALRWLIELQTSDEGHLSIIGNNGWHDKENGKSSFDQQPIEAMAIVEACTEAYRSTGDKAWLDEAFKCLKWYLGHNDLNMPLYDFETGGCRDGIEPQGINANQGAESTLAWLISIVTMYEIMGQQVLVSP